MKRLVKRDLYFMKRGTLYKPTCQRCIYLNVHKHYSMFLASKIESVASVHSTIAV